MKTLTHLVRFFVGVLFIFSGLIKLNDPVGFSFKLEEYFSEGVLNLPFLMPLALTIAVAVVIYEVVLGVMLLAGYKVKFTLWNLLGMIIFFTFLTFYSAWFNKVTDCGCFGDAIKLTPWESFTKDVVLLVLILFLIANERFIKPITRGKLPAVLSFASVLICGGIAYTVLNHLPFIDFRAYQVGKNITKEMQIPEDAEQPVIEMVFIYKVDGKEIEISYDDVMSGNIPENAEFVDRKDKIIKQGYVPKVKDFTMELNGFDYKEELLQEPKLVMIVAYDLTKSSDAGFKKMKKFSESAVAKGYKVIGMSSSINEVEEIKKLYQLDFDFYFCDPTTLKTIERANPSVVVLHKGTIIEKAHYNDLHKLILP